MDIALGGTLDVDRLNKALWLLTAFLWSGYILITRS